jgi:hypothetical protein
MSSHRDQEVTFVEGTPDTPANHTEPEASMTDTEQTERKANPG